MGKLTFCGINNWFVVVTLVQKYVDEFKDKHRETKLTRGTVLLSQRNETYERECFTFTEKTVFNMHSRGNAAAKRESMACGSNGIDVFCSLPVKAVMMWYSDSVLHRIHRFLGLLYCQHVVIGYQRRFYKAFVTCFWWTQLSASATLFWTHFSTFVIRLWWTQLFRWISETRVWLSISSITLGVRCDQSESWIAMGYPAYCTVV